MPRTILAIAQEAAERDATAPPPTSLFSNQDRIARILRTAAKDVTRDYLRRTRWLGQSDHTSTWVFALQSGVYAYRMPPDFLRMIPGTEQRNGWPMSLIGPVSPQLWAAWLYGATTAATPHGWRIRNNTLFVEPTPQADELVAIEYVSSYPVISAITEGDYNEATDPMQTNAPVVPRDGWLELDDDTLIDTDGGAITAYEALKRLDPSAPSAIPTPQVRRAEFTANTDLPAFSDDYLLSLGMTFHLQRALGLPYAERADEYEAEMEVKIAEDGGGARGFRLGGVDDHWDTWPLGDGKWVVT